MRPVTHVHDRRAGTQRPSSSGRSARARWRTSPVAPD